jgi:hypothetical protein
MELSTKIAWALLAFIHIAPALTFFAPDMIERLYSIPAEGDIGLLLTHRGALFLAVMTAAAIAIFMPDSRKLASIVVAISILSFLWLYARAGLPIGGLRKIAVIDAVAIFPLIWVAWEAWVMRQPN